MEIIAHEFIPSTHMISFFFTGHGYFEGAMCIQTQ
jgi:hypothetical protein